MLEGERELLGRAIDRVDNLVGALQLPLPDKMHVQQLRVLLPEIVEELKAGFTAVTGENPWSN